MGSCLLLQGFKEEKGVDGSVELSLFVSPKANRRLKVGGHCCGCGGMAVDTVKQQGLFVRFQGGWKHGQGPAQKSEAAD